MENTPSLNASIREELERSRCPRLPTVVRHGTASLALFPIVPSLRKRRGRHGPSCRRRRACTRVSTKIGTNSRTCAAAYVANSASTSVLISAGSMPTPSRTCSDRTTVSIRRVHDPSPDTLAATSSLTPVAGFDAVNMPDLFGVVLCDERSQRGSPCPPGAGKARRALLQFLRGLLHRGVDVFGADIELLFDLALGLQSGLVERGLDRGLADDEQARLARVDQFTELLDIASGTCLSRCGRRLRRPRRRSPRTR